MAARGNKSKTKTVNTMLKEYVQDSSKELAKHLSDDQKIVNAIADLQSQIALLEKQLSDETEKQKEITEDNARTKEMLVMKGNYIGQCIMTTELPYSDSNVATLIGVSLLLADSQSMDNKELVDFFLEMQEKGRNFLVSSKLDMLSIQELLAPKKEAKKQPRKRKKPAESTSALSDATTDNSSEVPLSSEVPSSGESMEGAVVNG